jgi:predicted  nucleic acid-binding Zn-ribbon protein
MSSEPENLVLTYLRRLDAKVDRLAETMTEHGRRLARIEVEVARGRRDQAADAQVVVDIQVQVDRLREEIDRINRRLDIVD